MYQIIKEIAKVNTVAEMTKKLGRYVKITCRDLQNSKYSNTWNFVNITVLIPVIAVIKASAEQSQCETFPISSNACYKISDVVIKLSLNINGSYSKY